jgi:hypothetical protein
MALGDNIVANACIMSTRNMASIRLTSTKELCRLWRPTKCLVLVVNKDEAVEKLEWVVYIHPDFIWNTPLAKTIERYDFWDYLLHEGLFLSAKEEATILLAIEQEYSANIDRFSKQIIISQLESLLNYADRFITASSLPAKKLTMRCWNAWKPCCTPTSTTWI